MSHLLRRSHAGLALLIATPAAAGRSPREQSFEPERSAGAETHIEFQITSPTGKSADPCVPQLRARQVTHRRIYTGVMIVPHSGLVLPFLLEAGQTSLELWWEWPTSSPTCLSLPQLELPRRTGEARRWQIRAGRFQLLPLPRGRSVELWSLPHSPTQEALERRPIPPLVLEVAW